MIKKYSSAAAVLFLSVVLTVSGVIAVWAASDDGRPDDTSSVGSKFDDVLSGAWYADAVNFVSEENLMSGVSETTFAPDVTMSRAMLATVLYRSAGSPEVTGSDGFTDTRSGTWYSDAVLWASQNGIISGYGNGIFGVDDPVSREQIAAMLWRSEGSPVSEGGVSFADADAVSDWAVQAVSWAQENGVVNGRPGNLFAPKDSASRAEVAAMLKNYMSERGEVQPEEPDQPQMPSDSEKKILVAYFSLPEDVDPAGSDAVSSASIVVKDGQTMGAVEYLADLIADRTGGDIFRIETVQQYPLDHEPLVDQASEEQDAGARPKLSTELRDAGQYDVIFLGYPIWWGEMPMPLYSFLEEYDFSGKTIIPFSSHGGSGLANTVSEISRLQPDASVSGDAYSVSRNHVHQSEGDVVQWLRELGYEA